MRKNLLLTLFAMILGMVTATAGSIEINIDNAANVYVSYGSDNTMIPLENGLNTISDLTSADSPLTIAAKQGAAIEKVLVDGQSVSASNQNLYRLAITEGMHVDILTSGQGVDVPTYQTFVDVNPLGSIKACYDAEEIVIDELKYWDLPAQEITLRPVDGYAITDVDYNPTWMGNEAVRNEDGSWSFTPAWDGTKVEVKVEEKGINFNVDINLPSNVSIVAWMHQDCNWADEGTFKFLNLKGYGPYTATAPEGLYALDFLPAEGGQITAITRIQANGQKTTLVRSDYVGWRSFLTEGDTFIINAVGPEVTFHIDSQSEGIESDRFVVSINDEVVPFTLENPDIIGHAGDVVTVAGGRGVELIGMGFSAGCGQSLTVTGPVQSFRLLADGTVFVMGTIMEEIALNIDNASAVVVKDQAGYGNVLQLNNGNNILSEVRNPLTIAPAEGYLINSVVLDGEPLKVQSDGTYTAALEKGSTLVIKTQLKPAAYPVTIVLTGEYEWLFVTNNDEPEEISAEANTLAVEPGDQVTISPVKGYLINSLTATNGIFVEFDEETGVYTLTVNAAGSVIIDMQKWVAAEGNVLIDYSIDDSYHSSAVVNDAEGTYIMRLKEGLNEVPKATFINLSLWGDVLFDKVLYNDKEVELTDNDRAAKVEVTEEGTLSVTTKADVYIEVVGYTTSDPVNHAIIGTVYINEEGQTTYRARAGETVTILPTPAPGYKFAGFEWATPADILDIIPTEAPYTFVVPEGMDYIMFRGAYVKDEEHPAYVVHTYQCYVGGYEYSDISSSAFVRFNTPDGTVETNDALIAEGDVIELLCYVDPTLNLQCDHFCLYTDPYKVIPQFYTVNGADANEEGIIEISAVVLEKSQESVDMVGAGRDSLVYDAASHTLYTPEDARIYSLNGHNVMNVEAGTRDLSNLQAGIYVVMTPSATIKIAR